MHRFFIPPEWIDQGEVAFSGRLVHQLRDVLRLRRGEVVLVLDNSGWEYEVELRAMGREGIRGVVRSKGPTRGEPGTRITLYQALLKGSKFEFVLQKGTELGIVAFVPIICERCLAGQTSVSEAKLARWRRIIAEAAEQSGRGKLPLLHPPLSFGEACHSASGLCLLPWEEERGLSLRAALEAQLGSSRNRVNPHGDHPPVNLFVGPEGGFPPSEVELARSCGILPVTLGHRLLRAETAALAAAAAILYHGGDLGG